jgi:hypothetical protein
MKQLLNYDPLFSPTAKTIDFSVIPNFQIDRLYAVINVTRNQILYAPGAPGLGQSSIGQGAGGLQTLLTLQWDTSSYSSSDELNVYYDTDPGFLSNNPMEYGGQLQSIAESSNQILAELKMMNLILAQGLNITDDIERLRNDVYTPGNIPGIN